MLQVFLLAQLNTQLIRGRRRDFHLNILALIARGSQKLEHNKLDRMSKIAENLTRKLSLGAKVLKVGGTEKIFRYNFSLMEGEKLIRASQCYISTIAGPIAGILFITTDWVAFCSEKSIELSSPTAEYIRIPYKVSIPIEMISRADESKKFKDIIEEIHSDCHSGQF